MQTESQPSKIVCSQNAPRPEQQLLDWAIKQLTILAVAFGSPEGVTAERLRIYAADLLSDLSQEQLAGAFARCRRELKFFPQIAELRELVAAKPEDHEQVEAEAAWQFANAYLQKHGVVTYDDDNRPPLDSRIDYALRRIGGLNGLNQITEKSRAFMFRDFCEAYRQAPMADLLKPLLNELFGYHKLVSPTRKQLTGRVAPEAGPPDEPRRPILKTVPEPLTEAQLRDRREMLKQQIATVMGRRKP